jgi:hypothetical protein
MPESAATSLPACLLWLHLLIKAARTYGSAVTPSCCCSQGVLDEYRFNMFMRDLLAEHAKDIFRCKGVLAVHVSFVNVILCQVTD